MTTGSYRFWGLMLFLLAGGWLVIASAGIHVGNQEFTLEPSELVATTITAVTAPVASDRKTVVLEGRVMTHQDAPVAGAMISASDPAGAYRLTVFSSDTGQFHLNVSLPDEIIVRVRAPGFEDQLRTVTGASERPDTFEFRLTGINAPDRLSETLTASAHAALLRWPDAEVEAAFVSQCHYCHQIGNELTRNPRTRSDWQDVLDRMEGYLVLLTDGHIEKIGDTLDAAFTGKQLPAHQTHDFSDALPRASIEEWSVGDGQSFIHDADIGADGKLYGVDEGHDLIWILDRASGKVERVELPTSDLPAGGLFSGLALPIGIFTGQHGPHSLAQGADGRFWITNALSSTLMSFDPETRLFEVYPIGRDTLYPHTIRIDRQGQIWFTAAASNQVVRFDPAGRTFTLIDLPSNGVSRWITDAFLPLILKIAAWFPRENLHIPLSHYKLTGEGYEVMNMPYGLDVNPIDGGIWYAKLYADRIGHIDPRTLEITEFETPLRGPRRPRFDRQGILWIPSFDEGALMRFDPVTQSFQAFPLPLLSPGEYETPYALNVHPKTGDIWITSNLSDRIFRFDPREDSFVSYPSPTRVTFLRDLVFSEDGRVCSTQSNLPAYAIETGAPSFICINPNAAQ